MKNRGLKVIRIIGMGLFFFFTFFAPLKAEDTIIIGVLGSFDDHNGKGIRCAAEMAGDAINREGGILGKKVVLKYRDDRYKTVMGIYGYQSLVKEDKAVAVVGTGSSDVALMVMEPMADLKIPFLPTGAASPILADKVAKEYDKYKYMFRVMHNSYELADFTTEYIIKELVENRRIQSIGLLIEYAVWTRPIAEKWEKALKAKGVKIPVFEYFYRTTKDFKPYYQEMITNKAGAVLVASSHVDPVGYISDWAETRGPMLTGILARYAETWNLTHGKSLSATTIIFSGVTGIVDREKSFVKNYRERYNTYPEYTSAYTYDALYILKAAIEKAGTTEPEALVKALEMTDVNGVSGRWVFEKDHHAKFGTGYRQFMMMQWQEGGKMCVTYPEELKTCDKIISPPWTK
ncbi:MAG: hypothetical protein CSYNP_00449 [Syntrophus sp. SKADARSKE-3]|nr:hypothetical protein [Syntrophus sp. SKADARSKE-3]